MLPTYDTERKSLEQCAKQSGLGHIDLFLLHSPWSRKIKRRECWNAVKDAIEDGEVKSGDVVCSLGVKRRACHPYSFSSLSIIMAVCFSQSLNLSSSLQELPASKPGLHPAVNQIEVHPFNTRTGIASFLHERGIVIEGYAPLARALRIKHSTLTSLSNKYLCTPAQLMIRWSLHQGFVILPTSVTKPRIPSCGWRCT